MSRLVSRGLSQDDADEYKARANGPHTVRWKANSYRWFGGTEHLLFEDIPLVGGRLTLDSSDPTRRKLTLNIGAAGELVPYTSRMPLAPFGQIIKLWVRIDRADGSWLPWLKMGEFPIQATESEWPSFNQTVECVDYSQTVDDYLHLHKRSYNNRSVRTAIVQLTQAALPNKAFAVHSHNDAGSTQVEKHTVAESGSGRWETATSIAQARGFETFFDWDGDLVIRHDITDDDNDSIPGVGPDIGTVSSPIAVIRDGMGGNLVALTASVSREGGANAVAITLHETVDQKARRKGPTRHGKPVLGPDGKPLLGPYLHGDPRVNSLIQALATGSIAWGNSFGRMPVVLERNVHVITDDAVAATKQRAKRLLQRRGGLIRVVDMDAVGLYWLEPDDKVRVQYAGLSEAHYVQSIEFDLSGASPARLRTRSLNVSDPG